jgi:hypothetical protein
MESGQGLLWYSCAVVYVAADHVCRLLKAAGLVSERGTSTEGPLTHCAVHSVCTECRTCKRGHSRSNSAQPQSDRRVVHSLVITYRTHNNVMVIACHCWHMHKPLVKRNHDTPLDRWCVAVFLHSASSARYTIA